MAKKSLIFEELEEGIKALPYDKFRRLMLNYAKATDTDIKSIESRLIAFDLQKRLEIQHINDNCPYCSSEHIKKNGTSANGLQRYKCNNCQKRFTRLTGTILDKTHWHYDIWVEMVHMIINEYSLSEIMNTLVQDYGCEGLDKKTIMLWRMKILHAMASVPMPKLTGVVQVDETFIRESQKGSKHLVSFVKGVERKPRYGRVASECGVMGSEFGTVTTAVDNRGYCVCIVTCLGRLTNQLFFEAFDEYFDSPAYLCSDANPVYNDYCKLRHIPHYIKPSDYLDVLKHNGYIPESKPGYDAKKNEAIVRKLYADGLIDEIVIDGIQIHNFEDFCEMKITNALSLGRVNQLHSDIKASIYVNKKNVSTKNLADYIGAFTYLRNWRVSNLHYATSKKDAESILIELIAGRSNYTINDIKTAKLTLPKPSNQYMRVLMEETKKAREIFKNEYFKFNPDDGFVTFQTRKYLDNQPTSKLKKYAKASKIKGYTSMSNYQLIHELLKQPNIDEIIYSMFDEKRKDKKDDEDLDVLHSAHFKTDY